MFWGHLMWRTNSGNRILSPEEWACFCRGLGSLRDEIESDLCCDSDDSESGVAIFDRLTPEQKLALLADVSSALRDPDVPIPPLTAINEGAVAAVLKRFWFDLCLELELSEELSPSADEEEPCQHRRLLLAAFHDKLEADELPAHSETDEGEWILLMESLEDRILWDRDFALPDKVLDLPPEAMEEGLQQLNIDREYFVSIPREPNETELIASRQCLARMIGVPVIDDNGLYSILDDQYHGLMVGPMPESELTVWEEHLWVRIIGCTTPEWECDYETWRAELLPLIPTEPFVINPDEKFPVTALPTEITIEQSNGKWVIRDDQHASWSGVLDNCWTDEPNEEDPALEFSSAEEAVSAFLQAQRMYDERAQRYKLVLEKLDIDSDD